MFKSLSLTIIICQCKYVTVRKRWIGFISNESLCKPSAKLPIGHNWNYHVYVTSGNSSWTRDRITRTSVQLFPASCMNIISSLSKTLTFANTNLVWKQLYDVYQFFLVDTRLLNFYLDEMHSSYHRLHIYIYICIGHFMLYLVDHNCVSIEKKGQRYEISPKKGFFVNFNPFKVEDLADMRY